MNKIIEINNITWEIKYVFTNDNNLYLDDSYHCGVTDFRNRIIYISDNLTQEVKNYTIKHELVHAILCSFGFQLKDEFNQEELCEFIAYNIEGINYLFNYIIGDTK